jgi:hypothetical protein
MEKNFNYRILNLITTFPLVLIVLLSYFIFIATRNFSVLYLIIIVDFISLVVTTILWFIFGNFKLNQDTLTANYLYAKFNVPIDNIEYIYILNTSATTNILDQQNIKEVVGIKPFARMEIKEKNGNISNFDLGAFTFLKQKNREVIKNLLSENQNIVTNESLDNYLGGTPITLVNMEEMSSSGQKLPLWATVFFSVIILGLIGLIGYLALTMYF